MKRGRDGALHLGSPEWQMFLIGNAQNVGIHITPDQAERMATHAIELMRWNQKINLTAITEPRDIAIKHFLDSILVANQLPANASVLDVGSGGGFPGIPLKVMRPDAAVVLIDSSRKKISFLNNMIRKLDLNAIETYQTRLEQFSRQTTFHNHFDVIICRAFASLASFIQTSLPLLAPNGALYALKGQAVQAEIDALGEIPFFRKNNLAVQTETHTLPHLNVKRQVIKIYPS